MPVFKGTIRLEDGDGLESSLTVDSGRFVVEAGEHEIGNWAIEELSVERRNGEFHIGVEGEELVVSVAEPAAFSELLGVKETKPQQPKKRKFRRKDRSQPEAAPPRAAERTPVTDAGDDQTSGPSLWQRIPTKWKLVGLGVIGLVALGFFAPTVLALLFMLAGMGTLFLAIAAKSESGMAIMPPPFFATTAASVGGIVLVLLAAAIMVIT